MDSKEQEDYCRSAASESRNRDT